MSLTAIAPARLDVAGRIQIGVGAGFASLAAPKLSEISKVITCAISGDFSGKTSVKTEEEQRLCDLEAYESVKSLTRSLEPLTLYTDSDATMTTILAAFTEAAQVGIFLRAHTLSSVALAIGDKGDAYNAKVASVDRAPAGVGQKWAVEITFAEVKRSALGVALVV